MTKATNNVSFVSDAKKKTEKKGSVPDDILRNRNLSPASTAEKEWAEAEISNAFIFGKVMSTNPDLLLKLVQNAMPEMHIQSISAVGKEVDVKLSIDAHGVRLDIAVCDDQGRTIDVEMQLRDEGNIPKRMRYYSGRLTRRFWRQAGITMN